MLDDITITFEVESVDQENREGDEISQLQEADVGAVSATNRSTQDIALQNCLQSGREGVP